MRRSLPQKDQVSGSKWILVQITVGMFRSIFVVRIEQNMLVEIKRIFRKENFMQNEEKSHESKRESML